MSAEIIVLRLVHILGGIFWVGSGLFTGFFLMPALASSGPTLGQVMAGLQQRRYFSVVPIVAVLTILSGLRLMWIDSAGFASAYFASASGRTFAASGAIAILAFALALLVVRPAGLRTLRLGASLGGMPEGAERAALAAQIAALQRRAAAASTAVVALLVLAAAGMAVARYLG